MQNRLDAEEEIRESIRQYSINFGIPLDRAAHEVTEGFAGGYREPMTFNPQGRRRF